MEAYESLLSLAIFMGVIVAGLSGIVLYILLTEFFKEEDERESQEEAQMNDSEELLTYIGGSNE